MINEDFLDFSRLTAGSRADLLQRGEAFDHPHGHSAFDAALQHVIDTFYQLAGHLPQLPMHSAAPDYSSIDLHGDNQSLTLIDTGHIHHADYPFG